MKNTINLNRRNSKQSLLKNNIIMKKIKNIGLALLMIIGLLFIVYYGYLRTRYVDVLHTEITLSDFPANESGIEQMMDWYVKTYHVPALTAAIIEDGKVTKYISRGAYSKENQTPVDEKSIYQTASLSKMFTGIISKSLAMEGRLDVQKPIIKVLGDALPLETQEKLKDITIENILFHNSGLGRSMYAYAEEDIINSLIETELEFQSGEKWQYSNYGYALLALILEKETGQTYDELLSQYVVDKYELGNMATVLNEEQKEKLVTPYWKHFKMLEGEIYDFGMQTSASGVFASLESLSKMMEIHLADYQLADSLKANSSLIINENKILSRGTTGFYGYGIFENTFDIVYDREVQNNYLFHGGDADGNVCNYGFFPEYNMGIVLLSSSGGPWFWDMERNLNVKLIEKHLRAKRGTSIQ